MAEALKNTIVQSLECPVCLNLFKDPKILSCSHTYCKACLDNLLKFQVNEQMVQCPVCRADSQVLNRDASLLQTNLALKSLIEDVKNQHQVCTNCKSEEKPLAVVYCHDCGKYLCIPCQTMHSQWDAFSDHEVIAMSDVASGKVSVRRFRKCRKHPREDEECFCSDCRKFACFRCVVIEHKDKGHRIIEASVYESNHLKGVKGLKSNVDKKLSCIQKYVDFIKEQKDLVSTETKQCIDDISRVYEESVRQLSEKKELLIDEVTSLTTEVDTGLDRMMKEAQEQITHMKTTTDLVANETKIPVDMDALAAHETLRQELQNTLKLADPDFEQPRHSSEKGIKGIVFKRNVGVDELSLKTMPFVSKKIPLPKKNSMNCMASTPDGRMAVGCHTGGINIYSVDGQLQQTVLKGVSIREVGFLSDGRCVVRNTDNKITLHTTEWRNMNKKFKTLNDNEGGWGGLDVDSDDHIYVGYKKPQEIHVFSCEGGKVIKEIPCNGYEPRQVISFNDQLIIRNKDSTVSVVDKDGDVKHRATRRNVRVHPTKTWFNRILIAWVNHNEGLVSIDEYNKELQLVKNLISDHKIDKPEKRVWYYLQEFRSGEIAFCTPDILHIFHRENVV